MTSVHRDAMIRIIEMCRRVFCEFRVFRVKKKLGAPPRPSPWGRVRLARWGTQSRGAWRLVMWVRRFRDIRPSRRDDPYYRNVPDGYSVNSVSSVFKKRLEPLPNPPRWGRGMAGAMVGPSPALSRGEGEAGAMVGPSPTLPKGRVRLARWLSVMRLLMI